jgi:hypothetical protein
MYMIIFFLSIRQVYIGLSVPTNIRTTANMYVSSSLCVPGADSGGTQGRIQDFKLGGGGAHLNKLPRAEGGANIFGVFRVKNHDFTPKKSYFYQF